MDGKPSPELEAYFELCKSIYLRLEREGRLDELITVVEENRKRNTVEEAG